MQTGEITLFGRQAVGPIEGPLFGQFFELAGRCIHPGLYDPESPPSRPDGLRADVVAMLQELKPTHIRYPGGCAAAYFDWQDLVGPRERRPRARLFRRTGVPQSTAFGLPEAWALCREVGAELYYTVNAHTQSPEEAANLVEFGRPGFADNMCASFVFEEMIRFGCLQPVGRSWNSPSESLHGVWPRGFLRKIPR